MKVLKTEKPLLILWNPAVNIQIFLILPQKNSEQEFPPVFMIFYQI